MDKKYITLKQASEWIPFAPATLYHMVSSKPPKIPHYKVGGKIMFSISDLETFMASKRRSVLP